MLSPSPSVPLSFAHLAALDVPPADLVEVLAKAGFASACVRTRKAGPGSPEYPLSTAAERQEVKARIAATGVTIEQIEMVCLGPSLDVEELKPMLEVGVDIGATRLVTCGDDADFSLVAGKLAEVCELARGYGMSVDIEFMPFRPMRTLGDALQVLKLADQPNAYLMFDALHFRRSNSSMEDLRSVPAQLIGAYQLCDAPAEPPADLMFEARNARLLPGQGGLGLDEIMDASPADVPIAVEVPLQAHYPHLDVVERCKLMASGTRTFLERRAARS